MSGAGHLGITIGNTRSVAVHRIHPDDEPTIVVLPTTLRFDEDGRAHLGEPADTAPFTRFVDLVGRQEDLEPDADAYRAEDLMANSANCLVTMVAAAADSGDKPVTTMTYPTRWPRDSVALLRDALDHTGLTAVALVPDAKAVSTFAQRNPGLGATVIDIGATGTDISTYPGGGTVRTTAVSGDVFTDALFDHVVTDREHIDLSDAAVLTALAGVVASCEAAKHTLSTAEDATISVELPGLSHTTTVTRAEFADLIAPTVRTLDVPQTDTVVLTGGSAALAPVAAEIAERSSGRLLVEPLAAARGALMLAEIEDVDGNSLVTGAAPVVTRNDGTDSLDTDAIPVVPPEKSLAFSEAIPAVAPMFGPSGFRSEPIDPAHDNASNTGDVAPIAAASVPPNDAKTERSERSRTITTVIAGAAAGVVIVLAIAAISGVFGSSPAPTPPTVTDAGSPVVTSTRVPSTTTVSPAPAAIVPEVVDEPTEEPYVAPQPAPLPAPPPAPAPPPVVTTTAPAATTTAVTTTPVEPTTTTATTATTTTPTTTPPTVP
ncbi:MAG: Hsp70 family protein [Rhodococcus sp. (in: high G+C Gram-positive bacteria)]